MSRNFIISPLEFYHLYDRGVERRVIFLDHADYTRFILLLYVCNTVGMIWLSHFKDTLPHEFFDMDRGEPLVDIGAYCLMPNHFHLLVRERTEGGIGRFMQKVMTGYTMYFNAKYTRRGSLFEGTYRARHADSDEYLKYLFAYIHLNPIKLIDSKWKEEGIKNRPRAEKYLAEYAYSSHLDYMGATRLQGKIIDRTGFPEYFLTNKSFSEYVSDWLNYNIEV